MKKHTEFRNVLMDEYVAAADWLDGISYQKIRSIESMQPVELPNATVLRGISFGHGVFLGRDRKFYGQVQSDEKWTTELTLQEVLNIISLEDLKKVFEITVQAAKERRK